MDDYKEINYMKEILTEMRMHNIAPEKPDQIIMDNTLHRYKIVGDKPGSRNGWTVIYLTHLHNIHIIVSAVFGSWKLGKTYYWCSAKKNEFTYEKQKIIAKEQNNVVQQFVQQKRKEQELVADKALNFFNSCIPAKSDQQYLVNKRIFTFCARQKPNGDLILPIMDCWHKLWSLQFINNKGEKRFLTGGAKRGNFIPIQGWINDKEILIGEGFATCATLAMEYPNKCVIAALDATNLEAVALAIAAFNPQADIIICGDDDRQTPGNPGATKARRAAVASGARYTLPVWPSNAPLTLTDFNDLKCWLKHQAKVEL